MTYQEAIMWEEKEKQYLDTLDLLPYLEKYQDINIIMDRIEENFAKNYPYIKEEGYLFNNISTLEFMDYLIRRYGTKFYEHTTYTIAEAAQYGK